MSDSFDLPQAEQKFREALAPDLSISGKYVALEPLRAEHFAELCEAAADGELWNLHFTSVPSRDNCAEYISSALENKEQGSQLPFIVRRLSDNRIVGSTRYYAISPPNRNMSIGYTWYAQSAQRTAVNSECKLLLLTHAFEQAACISVQWHTHHENYASQAAIERLGAVREGVLRNHLVMPDGSLRHTHCYSMLDTEWPSAKQKLQARLGQG